VGGERERRRSGRGGAAARGERGGCGAAPRLRPGGTPPHAGPHEPGLSPYPLSSVLSFVVAAGTGSVTSVAV
jgi:hypothetical protein